MSIVSNLLEVFKGTEFTLKEAYAANPHVNKESVRARIYEHIGINFEKLGKGLYITKAKDCVLIEGNGRDLSMINDGSIDCIITDHPWESKANKGGNRNFKALTNKAYKDAIEHERERIRFAIVQYALDNNLSIEGVEPFINIVNCK